jgi:hypothetical protein
LSKRLLEELNRLEEEKAAGSIDDANLSAELIKALPVATGKPNIEPDFNVTQIGGLPESVAKNEEGVVEGKHLEYWFTSLEKHIKPDPNWSGTVELVSKKGVVHDLKVGNAWEFLLFGGLVFFVRGMFLQALIWLALDVCFCLIPRIVLAVGTGNKAVAKYYLRKGYRRIGPNWVHANKVWDFDP